MSLKHCYSKYCMCPRLASKSALCCLTGFHQCSSSCHCFNNHNIYVYVCVCVRSSFLYQLEFSDDITRIIQTAINSDGGQPESRKANSMVKSFFIRVRNLKSTQSRQRYCTTKLQSIPQRSCQLVYVATADVQNFIECSSVFSKWTESSPGSK